MTSRAAPIALLVVAVAVIGAIDYASGPDIGFSLFYLVPIVWSAWRLTGAVAIGLAVLAAVFWLAADMLWHGLDAVVLWNAFTRLGIYIVIAWLTARVRTDQLQLRELNRKLQELLEQEQQLARTDALTELPNRRLFIDELRRAGARSHRTRAPLAVAFIDFEHLKQLNERLGHAAGDALLKRVAAVLAKHVRGNDVAARLGGDEFGILLDQCTEETARTTTERLLEQIVNALGAESSVGVNIGVACFDEPPSVAESMLDHADAAMFCAKAKGPRQIYIVHLPGGAEPGAPRTNLPLSL